MIKREKIELVRRKGIFVGIDIARSRHKARFIDNLGQERIKGISFTNDKEGIEKLEAHMKKIPNLDHNIIFGLEPSGDYWKPLAYYLKSKGYEVVLVNPYHVKRTKEIIDNTQEKNDNKDSYLIADLTKQGKYFFPILPEGIYAKLREVSISWRRTSVQLSRSKCYVSNFISKYFPEYRGIFSDIMGKTSLYILKNFPLPEDIKKIGEKRLRKIIKKVSKGKVKEEKIKMLYERAKNSIGLREGGEIGKIYLREVLLDIERLVERKKKLRKIMEEILEETGYKEYLLSVPGVGVVTGAIFLGEIGDPRNYKRSSQIEKLAGLNLVENSSGERKGEKKISKRGRNTLRYIGYLVSTVAISKNPEIKRLYKFKMEKKNKEKMKVLTAISAKMLRIMYKVCKDRVYYNPYEIKKCFY